ncbi:hypothetical protein CLOSTASPAR_04997 [[Clostridium] asparagiforme DSM 15981]|uniref:Uncharacterized protein n=1 Tax=[Clostridium] asparagiforme DSM 15981 TaxID=518636 RepID=C0D6V0_9FIRM|nr:hypothetical protein CLOSTASPAR_04997 [[Clostridium] asparagiforme DSM 15981]
MMALFPLSARPCPAGFFLCPKTARNCQTIPRGKGSIMGV